MSFSSGPHQNGISWLYNMLEIYDSGPELSIFSSTPLPSGLGIVLFKAKRSLGISGDLLSCYPCPSCENFGKLVFPAALTVTPVLETHEVVTCLKPEMQIWAQAGFGSGDFHIQSEGWWRRVRGKVMAKSRKSDKNRFLLLLCSQLYLTIFGEIFAYLTVFQSNHRGSHIPSVDGACMVCFCSQHSSI